MTARRLGCIADDYTGATDLAAMLVRSGRHVALCFGMPTDRHALSDADAVVIALKSRSIAPDDAVNQSAAALRFLQSIGAERFFFKYCSTFDSTPRGNIGPVADALAGALHGDQVIFCPAFPENGRTVYQGWMFVDGVPLHESSMKDHPLNPMTDSNLVRWLQAQSMHRVHHLPLGQSALSSEAGYYLADAITDGDLQRIAVAAKDHPLLTGGSAIAQHWADLLLSDSPCRPATHYDVTQTPTSAGCVILAGSCSAATRAQVNQFQQVHPVYPLVLSNDQPAESVAADALAWCSTQWQQARDNTTPLLICSAARPDDVASAQQQFGEERSARLIERIFAGIAQRLVQQGIHRLIVAGGETSGAVINALGIQSVRVGREIAPGVPWVESLQSPRVALVLKSGNFGGPRFFFEALEAAP